MKPQVVVLTYAGATYYYHFLMLMVYYFISRIVRSPWSLTKISLRKLRKATQIMGLISTPKAGGTTDLTTFKKGSVGQAITLNGNWLIFT